MKRIPEEPEKSAPSAMLPYSTKVTERILREPERKYVTGVPRVVWWRLERIGKVPKRVLISTRAVGWFESEILAWMRDRGTARTKFRNGSRPGGVLATKPLGEEPRE